MNTITFSYNNDNISVKINDEPIMPVETEIINLDEPRFYERFSADIIKDANTKTSIDGIAKILTEILKPQTSIKPSYILGIYLVS